MATQATRSFPGRDNSGTSQLTTESRAIHLQRERDEVHARVAELQWDLGGLVYEMVTRDRVRIDVIVKRAAELQQVDAHLAELDRILAMERSAIAGTCASCGAPHSSGAAFCWQCGQPILRQVDTASIMFDG